MLIIVTRAARFSIPSARARSSLARSLSRLRSSGMARLTESGMQHDGCRYHGQCCEGEHDDTNQQYWLAQFTRPCGVGITSSLAPLSPDRGGALTGPELISPLSISAKRSHNSASLMAATREGLMSTLSQKQVASAIRARRRQATRAYFLPVSPVRSRNHEMPDVYRALLHPVRAIWRSRSPDLLLI